MAYDSNNIFAKILWGEIPNKTIYEDEYVLAFHDIQPKKEIHAVLIPKGPYKDVQTFGGEASEAELVALLRAVPKVAKILGIEQDGFRLIANTNIHGGQEVSHLHFHLLGGEPVGRMVE